MYWKRDFILKICGVSILRAGEALEDALVSVCKDVTIGKILIQTNSSTTEPEVWSTLVNKTYLSYLS